MTERRLEYVKVETLREAPGNARKHSKEQIAKIAESIKHFGMVTPILITADNEVIAGHGRLAALRELIIQGAKLDGMVDGAAPCVRVENLSASQIRAYRIADNRLAEESKWNTAQLAIEIQDLRAVDFKLQPIGFSEFEISRLLAPTFDALEYMDIHQGAKRTAAGDLWELGEHRLLVGDATDPVQIKRLMGSDVARCLVTDPPWNVKIGGDSNPRHRQREGLKNDDLSASDFSAFLSKLFMIAKPHTVGDWYVVMSSSEWSPCDAALLASGLHFSGVIIWVKDMFVLGRSNYQNRMEPIWYGWPKDSASSFRADRKQDNVWEIDRPRASEDHPTEKPVALYKRAVTNSSREGDVVLDICAGTGPIFLASEMTGRRARGIEINPQFADVIIARWEAMTGKRAKKRA